MGPVSQGQLLVRSWHLFQLAAALLVQLVLETELFNLPLSSTRFTKPWGQGRHNELLHLLQVVVAGPVPEHPSVALAALLLEVEAPAERSLRWSLTNN